jgi:hypothetical protein
VLKSEEWVRISVIEHLYPTRLDPPERMPNYVNDPRVRIELMNALSSAWIIGRHGVTRAAVSPSGQGRNVFEEVSIPLSLLCHGHNGLKVEGLLARNRDQRMAL